MLSVSTIKTHKFSVSILLLLVSFYASAQENSPFSRYGLGDVLPSNNIVNRAMGSVSAAYYDGQSVNFVNPASYSALRIVTYDIGITIDSRNLKRGNPAASYNSVNFTPTYVTMGFPISKKKNIGMAFGLRPVSRINYNIVQGSRTATIDSIIQNYEGSGGLYQGFIGIGKKWGGLSLGINTGYTFGRKETSTRTIISDTFPTPTYNGNHATISSYGSTFIQGGLQYEAKLNKRSMLRFGVSGNLKQNLNGTQDIIRETFFYTQTGATVGIDSVRIIKDVKGKVVLPSSYTAGIMYTSVVDDKMGGTVEKTMIGVEYHATNWSDYRFFGQTDNVVNNWQMRIGAQYTPDPMSARNYWSRVNYRTGFYIGKDHVNADTKELPVYAFTLGAGFPIRKWRSYDNQFTNINTAIEFGKRGNKQNNITENFFRFSVGFTLSDIWFIKRRYD